MHFTRLFPCAALVLALGSGARAVTLSSTNDGVQVEAGTIGNFTIGGPVLKNKSSEVIPLVSRTAPNASTQEFKFLDDTTITISVDDATKTVSVAYKNRSAGAKTLAFESYVPFSLREGGKATFDAKTVDFPLELAPGPEGHSIWRGDAGRFEIQSALGQKLAIVAPSNWNQLQDNRFWNANRSFVWIYQFDLERDPAQTSFTIRFEDLAKGEAAPVLPRQIVDRFGQTTQKDFPGKIKSEDELRQDVARQSKYFQALKPAPRDIYGGLPGSREALGLKKTGFFHIEKIRDPQAAKKRTADGLIPVMVDPEGNLFFQNGVCSLGGAGDSYTFIEGRRDIYESLPTEDKFKSSYIDGGTAFSFYAANWARKNGKPWSNEEFMAQTVERLRRLGFNSEGAFSGWTQASKKAQFPRVGFLPFDDLETIPDSGGVFDPFAENSAQKLDTLFAQKLAGDNADPLIIGHFGGNEQAFENIPKVVPGLDEKSGAKRRLVALLRDKYLDIGKFNAAWEMKEAAKSFDELSQTRLFVTTKAAGEDVNALFGLLMEAYYKQVADAYRKHCPNHLLLGNRWLTSTANNDAVVRAGGKYLDVLSVNYYTDAFEPAFLQRIHTLSGGRPILLSEWHYGSTESGLSGGARQVKDQRERGLAYRNYVEQAAALGFVVGQEWFSYVDQPLTGRWFQKYEGEKGNIGLVNVADRPYEEMLSQATQANANVYQVLLGQKAPFLYDSPRFGGGAGKARKTVLIPRALRGMTINGIQDNWPGLPAERITGANLVLGTDAGPVAADFRLCWDDDNLYLLAQVKDPTPMVNENTGDGLWAGDSIEMFIGAENLEAGGALQFGDRQVLLGARGAGADGFRSYFANAPKQAPIKMVVVPDVAGDGYTIEAAIPFEGLGFVPRENQELLFDIGINDTTNGRRQLMWNGVARNSGDRGAWGRAKLSR